MLTSQKRIVLFSMVHLPPVCFFPSIRLVNCQFSWFPADFHCRNCKKYFSCTKPCTHLLLTWGCLEKFSNKVCRENFISMFCTLKGGKTKRGFISCCHKLSGIILNVFIILLSLILCSLS